MSAAPPERNTLPPGVTAGGSAAQSLQRRLRILEIAPTMLPNAITKMAALNGGRMVDHSHAFGAPCSRLNLAGYV